MEFKKHSYPRLWGILPQLGVLFPIAKSIEMLKIWESRGNLQDNIWTSWQERSILFDCKTGDGVHLL